MQSRQNIERILRQIIDWYTLRPLDPDRDLRQLLQRPWAT